MMHYLYFPAHAAACKARDRLQLRGFSTEVRRAAVGADWLVLARGTDEAGAPDDELTRLAAELGGEYDGWESEFGA